ncbi:hypothetical protein Y09_1908 [Brachybacterium sp. SW0106-09]|nr:hypothetical protein Y09_1908 [Brachybacterium sp. SW0106-09]
MALFPWSCRALVRVRRVLRRPMARSSPGPHGAHIPRREDSRLRLWS